MQSTSEYGLKQLALGNFLYPFENASMISVWYFICTHRYEETDIFPVIREDIDFCLIVIEYIDIVAADNYTTLHTQSGPTLSCLQTTDSTDF